MNITRFLTTWSDASPAAAKRASRRPLLLVAASMALWVSATQAQTVRTNVFIEQMGFEAAQIRVLMRHTIAGSTNFILQGITNFNGTASWASLPGAVLTVVDGGHVELRVPRPANAIQFFRVLSSISADDGDGDGLPAIAETGLGTNPNNEDSDGDGFSDGLEALAGTNPLDKDSFPTQSAIPVATFTNSISVATEGAGSVFVNIVLNRTGAPSIRYTINPRSTAVAGRDYQALSGIAPVSGTNATIQIVPLNDLVVRPERMLLLDLTEVAGYRIGIRNSHIVRFADDDAYWNGTLKDKYAERNFRVMLSRSNNVTHACFVAGENFDGLPVLDTSAPGSSISEGVIPAGCHDATVSADSATLFSITSPELAAGRAGIFAGNVQLSRTFKLESMTTNAVHQIDATRIVGTYTERIGITNTPVSYLDQTNSGAFVLVRELPRPLTVTNGVVLP